MQGKAIREREKYSQPIQYYPTGGGSLFSITSDDFKCVPHFCGKLNYANLQVRAWRTRHTCPSMTQTSTARSGQPAVVRSADPRALRPADSAHLIRVNVAGLGSFPTFVTAPNLGDFAGVLYVVLQVQMAAS